MYHRNITYCWQVFRYADVARVPSEYATFSSDAHRMARFEGIEGKVTTEADPIGSSIVRMDPPRHRQLRNLVSQAFTPRSNPIPTWLRGTTHNG